MTATTIAMTANTSTLGVCTILETIVGANYSARIIADRFDAIYVQYEFSRKNDQWRVYTGRDDMSHARQFATKANAKVCAKRLTR